LNKLTPDDREYYGKENWEYMRNNSQSWFLENVAYSEVNRINCIFIYYITKPLYNAPIPTDIYIMTNDSLTTSEKIYLLHLKNDFLQLK